MSLKTKDIILKPEEKNIITRGEWITDDHMYYFHILLRSCSNYEPAETWQIQLPEFIQEIPEDRKHIQILHSSTASINCTDPEIRNRNGHWVCSYYDRKNIYIYDSQNKKELHEHHKEFFKKLFPTYDFKKHPVKFPTVQNQRNSNDCGVFAIAFAISLLFNIKPDKVRYDHRVMRLHLLKIFELNTIEHFPQESQSNAQKVLPLAVIRARETEVARIRIIYQCKKKEVSYIENLKNICAKRRHEYQENLEENRAKRRCQYEKDLLQRRAQKRLRYTINSQQERDRYRNYSDRKWLYNKRFYERKSSKSVAANKNRDIAKNITRKYHKFWSRNYIQFLNPVAIEDIEKKLDIKNPTERRLEAERIVRWCMRIRDSYVRDISKVLAVLKKKSQVCLTLVAECSTIDDKKRALCGISRHTASSENYFIDTYRNITSSQLLVMNEKGTLMNVLPLQQARAKKSWSCNALCKIDPFLIDRYGQFLKTISTCTLKKIPQLLQNIHTCTIKDPNRQGHTHACYIDDTTCEATFLPVLLLSPHFPTVRFIKRLVYQMTRLHNKMLNLEKALTSADLDTLNEIITLAQQQANMYKHQQNCTTLSDDEIMSRYKNAFKAFAKRSMDTPRYVCASCERLCYKRSVFEFNKLKAQIGIPIWRDLMAHLEKHNITPQYICRYCDKKFRDGLMPAYCVLNDLFVHDPPEVISCLNEFEKILIQRAKAFQTVVSMKPVSKKKFPHRRMVQKVKGRTFHLPLPLQETLNKICSDKDPINTNHELYFVRVRNVPTKSKIIWEQMVDVKKVFDALVWLKEHNPLYSHIVLPDTYNNFSLHTLLKNPEYEIQKTDENGSKSDSDDEHESSPKSPMQETENNVDATLNNQRKAMITQVLDENNNYYEQYTIYPLYEKKECKSDTALYQMLKIDDLPLDNREKLLDLLCFPDLYPLGVNGEHQTRQVKLHDHEFVKCRLMSKHSQFRLNIQFLFFCLNQLNMRQLKRGIFHKLNITNRYTASEYLQAMETDALESNLSTIFATLRNTEQYWHRPRNNLRCMTQHYGPATFFLTWSPADWLMDDLGAYIREVNGWPDDSTPISVLVARDPVSTSRFLDNKFKAFLDFICSKDHPIGEVIHYFWRREYQGRGLQHFHLLVWIKGAPIIGESSFEEISKFILQHITCKMPDPKISPLLYRRVNTHQRHKHNDYCLRSKKVGRKTTRVCRFGFPRPVTETLIIRDVVSSIAGRKRLKNRSRLYDLPRTDAETNINDYNTVLLTAVEGNVDIQYIGEKSTLLTWYITKYINKAAKSEISDAILDSKNEKKESLHRKIWKYAMRGISNRECGALEGADGLLGIPLYGTDRNTTIRWLNVNQIRHRKVKGYKEIEALDGDSTDIFCPSIIDDHYPQRPEELESMSLYEFAQWYEISKIKPKGKNIEQYKMKNGYYLKRRQRGHLIDHYRYNVNTQPENYFFSLLLMFKPWRKIEDLKDGCDTYAESFHKGKLHLEKALQYHEKLEELQKAFETAQELVQQHLDELEKQHESQDDPDNLIGVQNVEAGEAMQDFKDLGDKLDQEIDVSEMISKLNADQKRVFDRVINAITSSDIDNTIISSDNYKPLRLYVSGEGGTGKSFLIKTIVCWIKQNRNKNTAVAAPTGIAAFNINGLTVHRLLQLPVEHGQTPKYKQLAPHVLKVLRADLKDVILIIIDEVSMISNLTLMYINLRLCEIFDTFDEASFGRKHILLFGDLLQLPPVREDFVFVPLSNEELGKYIGSMGTTKNILWDEFEYDELTINMRQQGDGSYRELLSRVRIGLLTKSDSEILEKRKISFKGESFETRLYELCDFIDNLPSDTVCLLPTRHMCDVLNTAMLSRIASREILLIAEDTLECRNKSVRERVAKKLTDNEDDNTTTAGLSKQIAIKIGAKVMIRRNIDASLGLVNGTIGTVISVVQDTSTAYVEKIKLLLPSGLEYFIERVSVKFQVLHVSDTAYVIRKQFPITPSYGITVHKSQGLSLQNAIMDIGNSVFSYGQVYVALSRVTSLDGLHLINFDPSSVTASERAINEYNRLKEKFLPQAQTITISKKRFRKVKDVPWTLSKIISFVQESDQQAGQSTDLQKFVEKKIPALQNEDKVSCYANSVLQCFFQSSIIRKVLLKVDTDELCILAHKYDQRLDIDNLNADKIRTKLGERFTSRDGEEPKKRDALEFLTAICTEYDYIRNLVEHQVTCTTRCKSCDNTKVTTNNNIVVPISINNLKKKSYNLNDLLKITFSHWCQSHDKTCEQCAGNDIIFKNELTSTKEIVIIHLILFSSQDNKVVKIPQTFNLTAIPTTTVSIAKQQYKVMNAIFHHGESIEQGCFTSMCRPDRFWIAFNDVAVDDNVKIVKKARWPNGSKNIYILFLEKVGKK